jgi:serine O-acetyltransferase
LANSKPPRRPSSARRGIMNDTTESCGRHRCSSVKGATPENSPTSPAWTVAAPVFQTDINPAAVIGRGIFLDHATGFVVGETAVIEDDVSILHGVTLGGTGKENEDRHPKIRRGVLIGAGAKILGNIEVGHCARIAAGSAVVKPVPHNVTVAGVPAKIVGEAGCAEPSRTMDQMINAIGL